MPLQSNPESCPVCYVKKGFNFIKDYKTREREFSLYQCQNCSAQFYAPFGKVKQDDYEKKDSYKLGKIIKPNISRRYHQKFLKKINLLPRKQKF